ncbi:acyltransferase family protein [Pseudoduganella armeniaca]|uniref:Acyltransferase n=1 Tax=Pseudoduganella armeniaca TaxID=2072590 RepID=A0A2R4CAE0_9BURK|nr:acyltransferase [Pseudoduganella armeniaca]AVR96522.1 acyltransferase [Pseudoduganella armeniaca]
MTRSPTQRLHGLDTLRALAILLVFANHYVNFVTRQPTLGWVGEIGWAGVDLFFALSGYLIGNQILAGLRQDTFSLPVFYARRLLRTLPNYYVVLALYAFWPVFAAGSPHAPWWQYLTFTLNFDLKPGTRFSHSWSLCVEEQFYMALPALALLVAGCSRWRRQLGWLLILASFVAGMLLRAHAWDVARPPQGGNGLFYRTIYYSTWCRFDELVAGVALALLKNCHAGLWARLTAWGNCTLALGIAVVGVAFHLFLANHFGRWQTIYGYPLLALGFGLLVLAALSPGSLLYRWRLPGAASLALWSYAIYLVHKQLCIVLAPMLAPLGIGAAEPLGVVLLLLASVWAGWLLYVLVETPFMRLRERWFGTPRRQPAAGAAGALSPS